MTILTQKDSRWANIKLGTSSVTIGGYGCTITCIAMILDLTPDYVNKRLLEVNGYAQGNLVIWDKLKEAFPGIEVRRVWTYDNNDVSNNLPCIVQVNGAPIGGTIHFVVYIGQQRLVDPWDGAYKATSTYQAQSYCVLKKGSYVKPAGNMYKGYDLSNPDSMKVAVDILVKVLEGKYIEFDKCLNPEIKTQLEAKNSQLQKEIDNLKTRLQKIIETATL